MGAGPGSGPLVRRLLNLAVILGSLAAPAEAPRKPLHHSQLDALTRVSIPENVSMHC